jgi:hypothetical protein
MLRCVKSDRIKSVVYVCMQPPLKINANIITTDTVSQHYAKGQVFNCFMPVSRRSRNTDKG